MLPTFNNNCWSKKFGKKYFSGSCPYICMSSQHARNVVYQYHKIIQKREK